MMQIVSHWQREWGNKVAARVASSRRSRRPAKTRWHADSKEDDDDVILAGCHGRTQVVVTYIQYRTS